MSITDDSIVKNRPRDSKAALSSSLAGIGTGFAMAYGITRRYCYRNLDKLGLFDQPHVERATRFKQATMHEIMGMLNHHYWSEEGGISLPSFVERLNAQHKVTCDKIMLDQGVVNWLDRWNRLTRSQQLRTLGIAAVTGISIGTWLNACFSKVGSSEKTHETTHARPDIVILNQSRRGL
jgi:hypothetical protein